ncbi:MAG: hypothetical protein ACYCS7_14075 [Acidimicrobiales bacterium]
MGVRRPDLVLVGAVVLSIPMMPGIISGAVSPFTALIRFLGAILLCWVAAWTVGHVLDRYYETARRAEIIASLQATTFEVPPGTQPGNGAVNPPPAAASGGLTPPPRP